MKLQCMRNTWGGINRRLYMVEGKNSKFEAKALKTIEKHRKQTEKKMNRHEWLQDNVTGLIYIEQDPPRK